MRCSQCIVEDEKAVLKSGEKLRTSFHRPFAFEVFQHVTITYV